MIEQIISMMKEAQNVAILPHISVDGDGLGSSLALGLALEKTGKKPVIYLEEDIPYVYRFLPGQHLLKRFSPGAVCADVIALDTGDMARLGKRAEIFNQAHRTVNIDHHMTNTRFASMNFVDTEASAVGEIIYSMIRKMEITLDTEMATCIYVAISTDTGGFKYSNTTPHTHRIAAELIEKGIDVAEISRKVFDSVSMRKIRLTGLAIHTLELYKEGRIACMSVSKEMIKKAGADEEDCDGLVNIARSVQDVEVAVLLKEAENGDIRVNLRANTGVDVSAIANRHSGGGHKKAAGCTLKGTLQSAKEMILKDIGAVLEPGLSR